MKITSPFFLLLILVVCQATPAPITYKLCSIPSALGKIKQVTISPNPVIVKTPTIVHAIGSLNATISKGAYWTLSASYNRITIVKRNGDLCSDSVEQLPLGSGSIFITGLKCPQAAGELTLDESAVFNYTPLPGTYGIHVEMYSEKKEQIMCLDIDVPM